MFKFNNKGHQKEAIDVILVYLLLTLNIFHNFFYYFYYWFMVDFERVNVRWETHFPRFFVVPRKNSQKL